MPHTNSSPLAVTYGDGARLEFFLSPRVFKFNRSFTIQAGGKGKGGKGGKFGIGKSKKSPQSRSARAGLQVSIHYNNIGGNAHGVGLPVGLTARFVSGFLTAISF